MLQVGDRCEARFPGSDDKGPTTAIVNRLHHETNTATVTFIEYGECLTVPLSDLIIPYTTSGSNSFEKKPRFGTQTDDSDGEVGHSGGGEMVNEEEDDEFEEISAYEDIERERVAEEDDMLAIQERHAVLIKEQQEKDLFLEEQEIVLSHLEEENEKLNEKVSEVETLNLHLQQSLEQLRNAKDGESNTYEKNLSALEKKASREKREAQAREVALKERLREVERMLKASEDEKKQLQILNLSLSSQLKSSRSQIKRKESIHANKIEKMEKVLFETRCERAELEARLVNEEKEHEKLRANHEKQTKVISTAAVKEATIGLAIENKRLREERESFQKEMEELKQKVTQHDSLIRALEVSTKQRTQDTTCASRQTHTDREKGDGLKQPMPSSPPRRRRAASSSPLLKKRENKEEKGKANEEEKKRERGSKQTEKEIKCARRGRSPTPRHVTRPLSSTNNRRRVRSVSVSNLTSKRNQNEKVTVRHSTSSRPSSSRPSSSRPSLSSSPSTATSPSTQSTVSRVTGSGLLSLSQLFSEFVKEYQHTFKGISFEFIGKGICRFGTQEVRVSSLIHNREQVLYVRDSEGLSSSAIEFVKRNYKQEMHHLQAQHRRDVLTAKKREVK